MSHYPGTSKIKFCRRLREYWQDLADYFDIPVHHRAQFSQGRECQAIWEWLKDRNKLQELPDALKFIERDDLLSIFKTKENNDNLYTTINWIIRLLSENELDWVQIEAMILPEQQEHIHINDVIVHDKKDSERFIIQANNNQIGEIVNHHTLNEMLEHQVPHAKIKHVLPILKGFLENQIKLKSKLRLTRDDILSELDKHGIVRFPRKTETEILASFEKASQIGCQDISRKIAGEKLYRVELKQIIELLDSGEKTILLTDRPGSGKTWLLLELADMMETNSQWGVLFIKGDRFDHIDSEASLHKEGLPNDIVGSVSRLSTYRKVVVIIDSLDVLSLSRDHRALKVFLSLLDRLENVPNVSIVAACRHFDLSYDPLLRNRNWSQKISIPDLDFESTVSPILKKWHIEPATVPQEQQKLLSVPQHLKLYEQIYNKVSLNTLTSSYQLYDTFLEEVVIKNSYLGEQAMTVLEKMAVQLIKNRRLSMSKASFTGNEDIYRKLVSSGVIRQGNDLAFSHQTLLDTVVTRNSLKMGKSLEDFILQYPPMPFIRPSVRTFLFYLRVYEPQSSFARQIRKVLNNDNIAYHLKRLVVESLAEIQPNSKDLPLFQWLLKNHTDFFRRFLEHLKGEVWFDLFSENVFQMVLKDFTCEKLRIDFVLKLRDWMNTKPSEVISFWLAALNFDEKMGHHILFILNKFERWEVIEIKELIESLLKNCSRDLGKVISQYVENTGKGDDLLWQYIVADLSEEEIKDRHKLENKLRCKPHTFHHEDFLKKRFCDSDELLSLILDSIENWSYQDRFSLYKTIVAFRNSYLNETLWRYKHDKSIHLVTSLTEIFRAIEEALNTRSKRHDEWWQNNEANLRKTQEAAIAYLLIQAYRQNIEPNISGIEEFLNREKVLQNRYLNYELGELIQEAYPFFSWNFQEQLQSKILLYLDEATKEESIFWIERMQYLLCSIPTFLRLPKVQNVIEINQQEFGPYPQSPEIYHEGGTVRPPVSVEQMMSFSDDTLLKLFKYYDQNFRGSHSEFLIGGTESVISTFQDCCALDPVRFSSLLEKISEQNIYPEYTIAIMQGTAYHLRYRFGNLQPSTKDWKPIEPLPDGKMLARSILNWLIKNTDLWGGQAFWKNRHKVADMLHACCDVLTAPEEVVWLAVLLLGLFLPRDPNERNEENNLAFVSANFVPGKAAGSAMVLATNLLKIKQPLPELFLHLLRIFAQDPVIDVRVSLLKHLPLLTYYDVNMGWHIW